MKITVSIFIIFTLVISGTAMGDDLLTQYMDQQTNMNRTNVSYGFGVNMPPLHPEGTGGRAIDLSAGLSKTGSCGKFNVIGELSALIDSDVIKNYLTTLGQSIISGAPMLLTCYASQTLCDLLKFVKNMANFAMNLRAKQCQQIEQLAANTGVMLRNEAMKDCVYKALDSGSSLNAAITRCTEDNNIKLQIPGIGELKEEYKLAESLSKKINDPIVSGLAQEILGTVNFSVKYGIQTTQYKQYAEEDLMTTLQYKYRNALKSILDNSINNINNVSNDDLKTVSIPGFPVTRNLISNLNAIDPVTRENFIDSYTTVAALNALLMKLRTLIDALEMEKATAKDRARIERLEEDIKKVERKYDLLYKNLDIQARYLSPMMQTLAGYAVDYTPPSITDREINARILPRKTPSR